MRPLDRRAAGLSKAVIILCTAFLVSLGLCGVNFVSVLAFSDDFISEDPHHVPKLITRILSFTGIVEVSVMALCIGAILILAIISVGIAIKGLFHKRK